MPFLYFDCEIIKLWSSYVVTIKEINRFEHTFTFLCSCCCLFVSQVRKQLCATKHPGKISVQQLHLLLLFSQH